LAVGIALAEEFTASVTKVEGGKIYFKKGGGFGKGGKPAEETSLTLASNVKYLKGKTSFADKKLTIEAAGDLEGGKEAFEKLVKDAAEAAKKKADTTEKKKGKGFGGGGVFTQLVTEGEGDKAKVTEIRVVQFGKKKDAQ
jgi:hypothetical protein